MKVSGQNWDVEKLSEEFLTNADGAEHYLNEIRRKLHLNKSYELIYDETLATFYVFNYLHGREFLCSREALLSELRNLLNFSPPQPHDVFDFQRFLTFRKNIIQELIRRFDGSKQ